MEEKIKELEDKVKDNLPQYKSDISIELDNLGNIVFKYQHRIVNSFSVETFKNNTVDELHRNCILVFNSQMRELI